jgi:hypothetical protein
MKSRSWMLASMVLVAACDGGGTNATGGDGGTGGSATGGNATGGSATGGNATGGSATGGSATGGNATGGSAEGDCSVSNPCTEEGESCVFQQGSCDPSAKGVCTAVNCDTPSNHGPVCLCSGEVFELDAECLVWSQSLPIADPEVCGTGTFNCGTENCTLNTQFCIVTYPQPGAFPSYECRDATNAEGTCLYGIADCACLNLMDLGCADASCCLQDGFYQETVTIVVNP